MVEHAAHPVLAPAELDVVAAVGLPGPLRELRRRLLALLMLDTAAAAGNGGGGPDGRMVEHAGRPVSAPAELEVVGAVRLPWPLRVLGRRRHNHHRLLLRLLIACSRICT